MLQATIIWLASLVTLPAPTGPVSVPRAPLNLQDRLSFPETFRFPPPQKAYRSTKALGPPPPAGPAKKSAFLSAGGAAASFRPMGAMGPLSANRAPGLAPSQNPSRPRGASFPFPPPGGVGLL